MAIGVRRHAWVRLVRAMVLSALAVGALRVVPAAGQSPTAGGPVGGKLLQAPHRRVVFDSAPFSSGSVVPYWDKGYLISRDVEIAGPAKSAVRLYDASGAKVRDVSIWVPGALRVFVNSAGVTPEGGIVFSGVAEKNNGTRAFYIGATNLSGKMTHLIQTNPFHPAHVCSAPDGTVWSFGSGRDAGEATLRRFDLAKGQLAAYLPRASFKSRFNPASKRGQGGNVFLRCSSDRIVIFSEVANEYLEMDYATETIHRWEIDRSMYNIPMAGFAVTESGEAYATLKRISDDPGLHGLFYLDIDRSAGKARWLPVEGQVAEKLGLTPTPFVLGADGKSLVHLRAGDWGVLFWALPVDRR